MGNSKCLLLLALALIIGSTGCQNSLLGGRFDTQSDARRWGVDWQQLDTSFWNSMKDSGDITSYQAYLEQFPSESYVNLASERIRGVKGRGKVHQEAASIYNHLIVGEW